MSYRPEIDGLRTIAVMSVIFYHAQILISGRDWFSGGFVGVDIFFVISGYLITRIILKELNETSRFSLRRFYERRARRIFPALLLVIICSLPFAWMYLLPTDLIDYARSIISAIFFSSNLYFAISLGDYGAEAALLIPFLHTWSLGVEEQFYVVIPLLLMALYRFLPKLILPALIAMAAGSLFFAVLFQTYNAQINFFLPMSRAWELGMGSIIAALEIRYGPIRRSLKTAYLPILGFAMIGLAIVIFNDQTTAHPALPTLLPVLGTGLIILFGTDRDVLGRLLASKAFVAIGLISYSAYLWHYPIFAFGRMQNAEPSMFDKSIWIGLTFILSALSYKFVEQPFRNWKKVTSKHFWISLLAGTGLILTLCAVTQWQNGFGHRVPPEFRKGFSDAVHNQMKIDGRNCHNRREDFCHFNPSGFPKLYVIGDSVLASAMPQIVKSFQDFQIIQITNGACYLFPDTSKRTKDGAINKTKCTRQFQNHVYESLMNETEESYVLLGGQLNDYIDSQRWFIREDGGPMETETLLSYMKDLAARPNLTLIFAKPTPKFSPKGYEHGLSKAKRNGRAYLSFMTYGEPRSHFDEQLSKSDAFFTGVEARGIGFVVAIDRYPCDEVMCYAIREGVPYVADRHHLADAGAKAYAVSLKAAIDGMR